MNPSGLGFKTKHMSCEVTSTNTTVNAVLVIVITMVLAKSSGNRNIVHVQLHAHKFYQLHTLGML